MTAKRGRMPTGRTRSALASAGLPLRNLRTSWFSSFQRKLESIAINYVASSFRWGDGLFRASLDIYQTLQDIAREKKTPVSWVIRDVADRCIAEQWLMFAANQGNMK